MRLHLGVAVGSFCIAAVTSLALAASSVAAVSCNYSASDRVLAVSATDSFTKVVRSLDAIQITDGHQAIPCQDGAATVFNTDRVQIAHTGRRADTVDLSGGPFAPGASLVPQGIPEIKIAYLDPTFLNVRGTAGPDRLGFAAGGVDLNGDGDADVTGTFSVVLIEGGGGNDLIAPQPDYAAFAGRRIMHGGAGRDALIATPDGSILHGGNGPDRLIGGRGADNLTGGRGRDLIRGGSGGDLIRAIDGTRDRVICGSGFDRAKVDGIDRVRGCEHLIKVKQTAPR